MYIKNQSHAIKIKDSEIHSSIPPYKYINVHYRYVDTISDLSHIKLIKWVSVSIPPTPPPPQMYRFSFFNFLNSILPDI